MLLVTSIVGYPRKLNSASAYLFANVSPLLFMLTVALYDVLVNQLMQQLAKVWEQILQYDGTAPSVMTAKKQI